MIKEKISISDFNIVLRCVLTKSLRELQVGWELESATPITVKRLYPECKATPTDHQVVQRRADSQGRRDRSVVKALAAVVEDPSLHT